ncbi:MAG TPA: bifunctional [glutamine synthetase] adenylyltransferase/[glutamine synthetase]-adenylyl-L-tyrosine phosphorylase [Sphingomicrobium sp.]|nr:bifunctional [glutamine synthetase] adenylyltransferase/[glutamine synthetase]-adenylyl-L-tyrosine phosphorylase [Sphingomicrobium sp.]
MKVLASAEIRNAALHRARTYSPFLQGALDRHPDLASCFCEQGSTATIDQALRVDSATVGERLRVQRLRLALAAALGDLSGELSLEQVTATLSGFADRAIDAALRQAIEERVGPGSFAGMTVLALGKLGSRELNYSSDVDLILLFDPGRLPHRAREEPVEAAVRYGRRFIELLQARDQFGYVARVDMRLRPSPEVTPIALSVDAAISYYESSALPWERAAFIRARACGGDLLLGQAFLDAIQPFVWRRSLDFGVVDEIREISTRIRDHYSQGQRLGPGYDLKRGRGGIREVEFYAQIQQLIHAGRDPSLRAPATLDALEALAAAGKLDRRDADSLALAYRRLRTVEHRVQMIHDAQTHLLPADPTALGRVAALQGVENGDTLIRWLKAPVAEVERLFGELADDRAGRLSNDPHVLNADLAGMGFADPPAVASRIAEWRSARARSLRSAAARSAFEKMLPPLMSAFAAGPDPARALNRFSDLVERLSSGVNLYRLLAAQPELGTLLATVLSHAPALADQLARRPELLDGLLDASSFGLPPSAAGFADSLRAAIAGLPLDEALDRARRFVGERRFGLGVQLVSGHRDPIEVAEGYSDVAEGALIALTEAAIREFRRTHGCVPNGELLILALGRLGGRALTHASDLDLVFVYDAPPDVRSDGAKPLGPADYHNRLARRVIAALSVPTAAGPLYEVDTRLRPQGEEGMLAVSLDGFATYQREEAWTWEHMALCRARPVFGSAGGQAKLAELVRSILAAPRDAAKVRADSAAMRGEMARHKPPAGPLDIKLGAGGLVDLEFAIHTLQLSCACGLDPRLEEAIAQLGRAGMLDAGQADADLRLLSRILVCVRLLAPRTTNPEPQSRTLLGRLCGQEDWDQLLAAQDAARHRIAALWRQVQEGT